MAEQSHQQAGNGADQQSRSKRSPEIITSAGRQLQTDAQNLVTHASEAGGELQAYLTSQVRERPMTTLAAAAGIGYVLGGGLSSKLTVLMLGVATKMGMAIAAREMSAWANEGYGNRSASNRRQ